tara:strand:+ start:7826 stop:8071 length:246 start_codon:yes stop_codon:yes gene_type:complete
MAKKEIINNPTTFAIVLFTGFFFLFLYGCPDLVFEEDGSLKQFGVGFRKKTILPLWMFSLLLGILAYIAVQYYILRPKFYF